MLLWYFATVRLQHGLEDDALDETHNESTFWAPSCTTRPSVNVSSGPDPTAHWHRGLELFQLDASEPTFLRMVVT